jgi:epoxyqueuosine reductase QueG
MKKIKLPKKSFFGSKIIRAFGKDSGLESPLPSREKKTSGVSAYSPHHDYHKQLRNAMLEAEKHKAKAIMEYKRRNLAR